MTADDVIHLLYWATLIAMFAFSWRRSRNFLHPHFMFTGMLFVVCSDFLVRGYDEQESVPYVPRDDLHYYQLLILGTFLALCILTAHIRSLKIEIAVSEARKRVTVSRRVLRMFQMAAWTILMAEITKRLSTVHWSLEEMISQMQNPRGERDWDQAMMSSNFMFAVISILLPLAAVTFAYVAVNFRRSALTGLDLLLYVVSLFGYAATLAILVTDGSRTPVVISLSAACIFILLTNWSRLAKIAACGGIGFAGAILLSLMILLRGIGFSAEAAAQTHRELGLVYHQDDSYYRALYAFSYADRCLGSWDPLYFAYTILMNPIPRYFWPEKPLIDEQFYGGYKLYWVTDLFVGEIAAMSGTALAPLISVLVGAGIYRVLYRAALLLRSPLGVAAYLLVALYVYMMMRSLMNVTMFAYLPFFAVVLTRVAGSSITLTARKKRSLPAAI
jgi:hypothetical protein